MIEFKAYPKTPRLFREIVITEKIDGTNAAVQVLDEEAAGHEIYPGLAPPVRWSDTPTGGWESAPAVDTPEGPRIVVAQSRNRLITSAQDNFGFARWVEENALDLAVRLGVGTHFGEWWGSGIGRGYGLRKGEKRFSLFNVGRWTQAMLAPPTLDVVPTLYRGPFRVDIVQEEVRRLRAGGSFAAPGFDRPEGIIVYHTAAGQAFKVTLEGDDAPKGRG